MGRLDPYKQVQIETAGQGSLILLLYDEGIKALEYGRDMAGKRRLEATHRALMRARDVVIELKLGLNMKAGDVAKTFLLLYDDLESRIVEADVRKEEGEIDRILRNFIELREAWKTALRRSQAP
ncbi:MAG: flagellar export chaperone FliS [bacterium]